jgi:hypothetical protein
MVDIMKTKFCISKYSQVFNRVGPCYGGLAEFIFKDITLVLLMLSFIQLAVHLPYIVLMPDCSRLQSSGDVMVVPYTQDRSEVERML